MSPALSRLKAVAYTSRAQFDISERDLFEIRESARVLNGLDGITGLLIFDGVRFLQIIEGSEDAIDNAVGRLRLDKRHLSFEVRDERFIEERSFSDWSMRLVRVTQGYREARSEIGPEVLVSMSPVVRDILMRMLDELAAGA